MFFWFFKQLYYNFKRLTKHKFLILFVFFILAVLLFFKPSSAYALTFTTNVPNKTGTYNVPDLDTISSTDYNKLSNGYLIGKYTSNGTVYYELFILNEPTDYLYYSDSSTLKFVANIKPTRYGVASGSSTWGTGSIASYLSGFSIPNMIFYGATIYTNSNKTGIYFEYIPPSPFITTSSSSIINFSFNYLSINAIDLDFNDYYEMRFTYPDVNTSYTGSVDNFKFVNNGTLYFDIPKSWFTDDIVVRSGSRISFDLIKYHREGNAVTSKNYSLGSYILDLTAQEQEDINEDSNKQLLSDINKNQEQTIQAIDNLNNSQQETTNAINNLNNTITDDDVDFEDIDLPTDDSEDITQDGVNNIFTSIYNAFCTGQAQDIIFPIPFTNKNITLSANYVRYMLSNNGATWVITLIEAFWWYLISRFIIKDIINKINKIKSGNIESIEQENIKGDML